MKTPIDNTTPSPTEIPAAVRRRDIIGGAKAMTPMMPGYLEQAGDRRRSAQEHSGGDGGSPADSENDCGTGVMCPLLRKGAACWARRVAIIQVGSMTAAAASNLAVRRAEPHNGISDEL